MWLGVSVRFRVQVRVRVSISSFSVVIGCGNNPVFTSPIPNRNPKVTARIIVTFGHGERGTSQLTHITPVLCQFVLPSPTICRFVLTLTRLGTLAVMVRGCYARYWYCPRYLSVLFPT